MTLDNHAPPPFIEERGAGRKEVVGKIDKYRSFAHLVQGLFISDGIAVLLRSFHFLLFLALSLAAGCVPKAYLPERSRLVCPEPEIVCRPGRTTEVTIDTSSSPSLPSSHYLTITRVDGLNTPIDEFGVQFQGGRRGGDRFQGRGPGEALATVRPERRRRPAADKIVEVAFSRVNKAMVTGDLSVRGASGPVGVPTRSTSGDTMFFTARGSGTVSGDYDLFMGNRREGVGFVSSRRVRESAVVPWDGQPALSPDGRTLYFASDRKGSLGGVDIWMCVLGKDGMWSDPINCGPGVNTQCDDLTPWVSGDGRWLYFSSSGHSTVGGYDLFRSRILTPGQFGKASNLGRPINTIADELGPSAPSGADPDTLLYYSSDQPGSQLFDVYVLHRLPRSGGGTRPRERRDVTLTGTVIGPDGRPVDSALVTVSGGDPPETDSTVTDVTGRYRLRVKEGYSYELIAGSPGTLYMREIVRIPIGDGRTSIEHDVRLPDTVTFRVNFPFNNATDPYEFTLDDRGLPSDLRWVDMIDQAADFLRRMNGTSNRFEIVGHTDPVGSDPFNMDLGRRRADFIRRELVKRGVSADILSIHSEGEGRPLVQMQGELRDTYHARLRRVELVRKK